MNADDIQLEPLQVLVLWKLIFTGEEPQKSKMKPNLSAAKRDQLCRLNLIEYEKRQSVSKTGKKTSAQHVVLTDEAWRWAAENLDAPFSVTSTNAGPALAGLLPRLKAYMESNGVTLAEILSSTKPNTEEKPENLRQRIRDSYFALSQGRLNIRVRLADLRGQLHDISRHDLDRTLLAMQADQELLLYTNDDPLSMNADDHDAALDVLGAKRHIVYMER